MFELIVTAAPLHGKILPKRNPHPARLSDELVRLHLHQHAARMDAQLGKDLLELRLDGVFGYVQRLSDLLVGQPLSLIHILHVAFPSLCFFGLTRSADLVFVPTSAGWRFRS